MKHSENSEGQVSYESLERTGSKIFTTKNSAHRTLARYRVIQVILLIFLTLILWRRVGGDTTIHRIPKIALPEWMLHSWAQYSPAFPVQPYLLPPEGCTITQVNILQRHGARFPTSGASIRITSAIMRLQKATSFHDPQLNFLNTYRYDLGRDDLINFGAAQSFDSGREAFTRYRHLVSRGSVPFIRASGSPRVIFSAHNWTAGFVEANRGIVVPAEPLILNEAANDTLDDKMCDNAGDSDAQTEMWQDVFAPSIAKRLNDAAPGAGLTNADIPSLISLCAFDTLAKEVPSPWCGVFSREDFTDYEYYGDLDKYYNTGYGQPLGPVQGVGYINELLARLTGKPVSDATQTNSTLDSSPETFPLNRTIYADFSHDNQMIAIYAAMGILRPSVALDPTTPDPRRTWIVSHLTPFGAKFVVERLSCGGQKSVRILMNDAVVPLEICGAGVDGVCTLEAFVGSQEYARNNGKGDWEKCFS